MLLYQVLGKLLKYHVKAINLKTGAELFQKTFHKLRNIVEELILTGRDIDEMFLTKDGKALKTPESSPENCTGIK